MSGSGTVTLPLHRDVPLLYRVRQISRSPIPTIAAASLFTPSIVEVLTPSSAESDSYRALLAMKLAVKAEDARLPAPEMARC
jgi:hypothetical protein